MLDLYRTIRTQLPGTPWCIGCNTIGHLAAGLVEAQRIGDDTSGREWSRTRKMGVNTLAFRMPQHNTFFAADPDCVPVTTRHSLGPHAPVARPGGAQRHGAFHFGRPGGGAGPNRSPL